jgi:hypothetical protein
MFYFQVGWIRPHPHLTCAAMYKSVLSQLVTCRGAPFRLYINNLLFPEPWIPIPDTQLLFKTLKGDLYPYSIFEVCFCTSRENEHKMGNMEAEGGLLLATSVLASVTVSGCASTSMASTKDQPQPAQTSSFISPGQREVSVSSRARRPRRRRRRNHKQPLLEYYKSYVLSPPSASLSATPSDTVTGSASPHLASTKDQPQPATAPSPVSPG